jgi:hypothetical protein
MNKAQQRVIISANDDSCRDHRCCFAIGGEAGIHYSESSKINSNLHEFNKQFKITMTIRHTFINLGLEIVNTLVFFKAFLKLRNRNTRMILYGTMKRQSEIFFFKRRTINYVEKYRKGKCVSCGVCCKYIRKCPHLSDTNKCNIYFTRHLICRVYPVSDDDIRLVSKISDKKCGFYFSSASENDVEGIWFT